MNTFDPEGPVSPGAGIFGLPHARAEAGVTIVPVPCEVTVSYRAGTAEAPAAIRRASHQVDLYDLQTGRAWEGGIHMLAEDPGIAAHARRGRELVLAWRERGEGVPPPPEIDEHCLAIHTRVEELVAEILAAGAVPAVLGGDHSVAFGGIAAAGSWREEIGVLQIDAHADLRPAYESLTWSHASVMHNVLKRVPGVRCIVQLGIRDLGASEHEAILASQGRVVAWFDLDCKRRQAAGERWGELARSVVAALPEEVWVSLDVDGLDPSACPHTGTPVPGGLSFWEVCLLLEELHRSGRRIVGFDLCEVAPGPEGAESLDAIVGARLLHKLCGFALLGRQSS